MCVNGITDFEPGDRCADGRHEPGSVSSYHQRKVGLGDVQEPLPHIRVPNRDSRCVDGDQNIVGTDLWERQFVHREHLRPTGPIDRRRPHRLGEIGVRSACNGRSCCKHRCRDKREYTSPIGSRAAQGTVRFRTDDSAASMLLWTCVIVHLQPSTVSRK